MLIAYFKESVCVGIASDWASFDHDDCIEVSQDDANKVMYGANIDVDWNIDLDTPEYDQYLIDVAAW